MKSEKQGQILIFADPEEFIKTLEEIQAHYLEATTYGGENNE